MALSRRSFMNGVASVSGASAFGFFNRPQAAAAAEWPAQDVWDALGKQVGGRLLDVFSPFEACDADAGSEACAQMLTNLQNPFFAQRHAGATQTNGWLDAWTAAVSPKAVAAGSAADVAAAVNFARDNNVRLVVKGAGHDYLGRSNAPDSLLVWTYNMNDVVYDKSFRPKGAPKGTKGIPAVTAEAGAVWLDVYQTAIAQGRYVQGGGCTSVGACGGFTLGGGYGSFSKCFGSAAGSVLEFEVVTADGEIRIANEYQNEDLFWALRGGGGGTFGIVTKVTYIAHEAPKTMGIVQGSIKASRDLTFHLLLKEFVAFFPDALNNPHWGEQIIVRPDNSLGIFMTFLDLEEDEARAVWDPFVKKLAEFPDVFEVDLAFSSYPLKDLWNPDYWKENDPDFIIMDDLPGAAANHFWWKPNAAEVAEYIYTYQSRWLPLSMFEPGRASDLVDLLFQASRYASVPLHINKGLAGVPPAVAERDAKTSINPVAFDAAAIVIMVSRKRAGFPGIPGHEPDVEAGRKEVEKIDAAMKLLREATPDGGTYLNECDYFEPDWRRSLYGPNYVSLLKIKRKYDPGNLFRVHHGVGSEL